MPDETSTRTRPTRWLFWFVGFLLAVVVAVVVIRGQRLPRLDRARFDAAKALWNENRLSDYEIAITVKGRQPGVYAVEVQQGIATAATLDGRDLKRPRTFGTWSVDGMFSTIERDIENNEAKGHLILGAEFHESLGVPLQYERLEMQTGVHDALHWEVTRFESP